MVNYKQNFAPISELEVFELSDEEEAFVAGGLDPETGNEPPPR